MKIDWKKYLSLFSQRQIVFAALCLTLIASFVYSNIEKDIIIKDIGTETKIITFKNTVGDVLKEKKISLRATDRVNVPLTTQLTDGLNIVIIRAVYVKVHADGKDSVFISSAKTVDEALKEARIHIGVKDKISIPLKTELTKDIAVNVVRVVEKTETKASKVLFTNEVQVSDKLEKGLVRVIKKGKNGTKTQTICKIYEDGKLVNSRILQEKIYNCTS